MRNKTTYEMEDVMNLIAKDLADKGLAPDPGSIEIWACIDGARVSTKEIEVEVSVSWVGIPLHEDSPLSRARTHRVPDPDPDTQQAPKDLLDEAPSPRSKPVLAIGDIGEPSETVADITTASTRIARSGGPGPFAPERVNRRLSDDESTEWPGNPPARGR